MGKIFISASVAISTIALMLSIGVLFSQASEKIMEKEQTVNDDVMKKDAMTREVETLINTGKMILEEGKKTNNKQMIDNGQLMIQQGQMIKEGKLPQ